MSKLNQDLKEFSGYARNVMGAHSTANRIDQALERIKGLELDLGLSNTVIRQKVEQLASCESALAERDQDIAELKARLSTLQDEVRCMRCLEDSYDTQEVVMGQIFLKLNDLCDEIGA